MKVLGINWEQNSTASLSLDGEIVSCISEERFTRIKNDEQYPINAINWILESNNINSQDLDAVVFVSKQWSPGYILTRHYTKFNVKDYIFEQHKIWKPRLFEKKNVSQLEVFNERIDKKQFPGELFWGNVIEELKGDCAHVSSGNSINYGQDLRRAVAKKHLNIDDSKIYFTDHSFSHACYAYYSTPIEEREDSNLVLTMDGFGDNVNYSAYVFRKRKGNISSNKICSGDDFIIGRLYRYITLILGLKPNEHEYKVMGLAPYCKKQYYQPLLEKFKEIQDVEDLNFVYKNKPKDLYFSIKNLLDGERFDTISGALQAYTEYLIKKWVKNIIKTTGINKISIAGGVAMNVKANMLIAKLKEVRYLNVPPSPDDSSQGMGAIFAFMHDHKTIKNESIKPLYNAYFGRIAKNSREEIISAIEDLKKTNLVKIFNYEPYKVAKYISNGLILARCVDKEEFGARALGNRSILADPRKQNAKKKINEKVKNRDFWMPFACSVLDSHSEKYFLLDSAKSSYSYMTLCAETTPKGSEYLQAAIHPYDETCRPHLVSEDNNKLYFDLIKQFGDITGVYGLLNTSFNHHGAPIVSNLEDALKVFFGSDLDGLIFNDNFIIKNTFLNESY